MVIVAGLVLLVFGLYLAFISWPAILGALSLACFFAGAIAFIVGFSERRARRDYERAINEVPSPDLPSDEKRQVESGIVAEKSDRVAL